MPTGLTTVAAAQPVHPGREAKEGRSTENPVRTAKRGLAVATIISGWVAEAVAAPVNASYRFLMLCVKFPTRSVLGGGGGAVETDRNYKGGDGGPRYLFTLV